MPHKALLRFAAIRKSSIDSQVGALRSMDERVNVRAKRRCDLTINCIIGLITGGRSQYI